MTIKQKIYALIAGVVLFVSLVLNIVLLAGNGVTVNSSPSQNVSQEQTQKQHQSMVSVVITASDVQYTGDLSDDTGYMEINSIEELVRARKSLGTMAMFSELVYFDIKKEYDFIWVKRQTVIGRKTYLMFPITRVKP